MQQAHLKLKEIIWEITGICNNNCNYCGSKQVKNNEITDLKKLEIADQICEYPPEQIDISGGDPLLINPKTHQKIVSKFKAKKIICKILFNPKSLQENTEDKIQILNMYDWVGMSINTSEELDIINKYIDRVPKKFTVITNFNAINLYEYEKFEEFVIKHNCPWMVQFTIYRNNNNQLAIYNNDTILNQLQDKIQLSFNKNINVIISDNMRSDVGCGAGLNSIGILYDGTVIPCLSMRSWADEIDINQNVLHTSLQDIWVRGFPEQRFGKFECCKDFCKNKCININKDTITSTPEKFVEDWLKKNKAKKSNPYTSPYPGSPTIIYGVQIPNSYMYAVQMGYDLTTSSTIGTEYTSYDDLGKKNKKKGKK